MTEKKIKVAINGFGRIGRAFFRLAQAQYPNIDIVAINDLGDINNLAYLLRYDTAQGKSGLEVSSSDDGRTHLFVNGNDVRILQEREPQNLPWGEMDIDVVIESTGFFTKYDQAALHLDAGAKRVVISAPGKGEPREGVSSGTALLGVNNDTVGTCQISSNGSCTTNASAPVVSILNDAIGIEKALLNTTHAYTATQAIVDSPAKGGKDYRAGRAAAQNIIPSSTGAAVAVTQAIPALEGKFDGIACRVPVVSGSIADVTFLAKRDTSVEEVNQILKDAAKDPRWEGIFMVTEEPIVSSDIIGNTHASIADLPMTRVVDGNLVKVMAWYDNEMGYTNTLVRHVIETGSKL
ncbi:type I glyceraldehyde-3-phosphate dehydrogenase [Patescibacteria group bacterium]|nr:type I glyceraldehyde-3-phosphate dehydrogenase [Patescibacteria group bacterium]